MVIVNCNPLSTIWVVEYSMSKGFAQPVANYSATFPTRQEARDFIQSVRRPDKFTDVYYHNVSQPIKFIKSKSTKKRKG